MTDLYHDLRTASFFPRTLVELLRWRAERQPEDVIFTFLVDGDQEEQHITFAELDRQARAIAYHLQKMQARGERAILLYPPGVEYIAAFFGCLYAGVTAVPAYPPRLNRPVPRLQGIAADCHAFVALTNGPILENIERRFEQTPDLQALHWVNTENLTGGEAGWRDPGVQPQDLAFLQYTSGSTSQPKGVMLTHANLLYNLEMIRTGFQMETGDRGIIWLPSYHDMGLIGGILEPIYTGSRAVLMAPFAFLQRPFRWLDAISRYHGNVSGAPNFAYDLCVDKITPEQKAKLDLSSWHTAFCGAEPVRIETLNRFAAAFAECGFQAGAFYPCYGLAEASLIVTGGVGPNVPVAQTFRRQELGRRQVVIAEPGDEGSLALVSCGSPLLEEKVLIVDPDTLEQSAPDRVGEIWVAGRNVAEGYWNRPEETAYTFGALVEPHQVGPYMRTGDLGFFHKGELYIAGRSKDLIIIGGTNHYPQDIELTVESAHEALEPSAGAAFSVENGSEERLVVVQEVNRHFRNADLDAVVRSIRRAVSENHDLQVSAVALIKPMSIPKTSSGKIKRHACKANFLEGALDVIHAWQSPQLRSPA